MFCEKAIVSTNIFGISDQFTNGYDALLFDVDDSEACYKNIEKLITDDKLRNQIGQNAKRTLIEKFNSDITFKRYIELLLVIN